MVDHVPKAEIWTGQEFHAKAIRVKLGREEWQREGRSGIWTEQGFWNWLAGLDLVVIDDIGLRDRATEALYENVKAVLDRRAYKPLVITSNLGLKKLGEVFDGRVVDRLAAGTVIELAGDSMR